MLTNAVLDVDFALCRMDSGESCDKCKINTALFELLPFITIVKVVLLSSTAEDKDQLLARRGTFLNDRAERSYSGTGANHDQRFVGWERHSPFLEPDRNTR